MIVEVNGTPVKGLRGDNFLRLGHKWVEITASALPSDVLLDIEEGELVNLKVVVPIFKGGVCIHTVDTLAAHKVSAAVMTVGMSIPSISVLLVRD